MKSKKLEVVSVIVGGVMLLAAGYGLFELISLFFGVLESVDEKLSATLITAAVTILVSVFTIVGTKFLEHRSAIRKEIREKKIPVYEELLQATFSSMFPGKQSAEDINIMIDFLQKNLHRIAVWTSDDVLSTWIKFRVASIDYTKNTTPETTRRLLLLYEEVMKAIRRDLGHKNTGLDQHGTILKLFINDIDSYLK